ncbi:hypothetical protein TKK_0017672 [Trichogramma kaykai]
MAGRKIRDLTLYDKIRGSTLTIKVTYKSGKLKIRTGSADLFFITASDETGHIKCNFLNRNCNRFYNAIKMNTTYELKSFSISQPNSIYNYLQNEIEITIIDTTIIRRLDTDIKCLEWRANHVDLTAIPTLMINEVISTTAILQTIKPRLDFHSKKRNKQFSKRELELIDNNNFMIILTLWGENSYTNLEENIKYLFKNVTVYRGNYIIALNSTLMTKIEKIEEDNSKLVFEDVDEEELSQIITQYSSSSCEESIIQNSISKEPQIEEELSQIITQYSSSSSEESIIQNSISKEPQIEEELSQIITPSSSFEDSIVENSISEEPQLKKPRME